MHLHGQKLKRQYYNLRRGVLTRADLTPFPGLHSPWAYVRSGMHNRRVVHSCMNALVLLCLQSLDHHHWIGCRDI